MNAVDALRKEKVETHRRIKALKKGTTNERLQKEALDCEREITIIKRGGKNNNGKVRT